MHTFKHEYLKMNIKMNISKWHLCGLALYCTNPLNYKTSQLIAFGTRESSLLYPVSCFIEFPLYNKAWSEEEKNDIRIGGQRSTQKKNARKEIWNEGQTQKKGCWERESYTPFTLREREQYGMNIHSMIALANFSCSFFHRKYKISGIMFRITQMFNGMCA